MVMPNLSTAYKEFKIKTECDNKLEHYYALNEKKGERQKVATSCGCCKKVDAVDHFEEKRKDAIQKFNALKAENENK